MVCRQASLAGIALLHGYQELEHVPQPWGPQKWSVRGVGRKSMPGPAVEHQLRLPLELLLLAPLQQETQQQLD